MSINTGGKKHCTHEEREPYLTTGNLEGDKQCPVLRAELRVALMSSMLDKVIEETLRNQPD